MDSSFTMMQHMQRMRKRAHGAKNDQAVHRRAAVAQLQPDDFDGAQYKVEIVRTATTAADASDDSGSGSHGETNGASLSRDEVLELVFVAVVFLVVLGGCVVIGLAGDVKLFARGALQYVLPPLLLPIAWIFALHMWERSRGVDQAAPSSQKPQSPLRAKIASR